jgi:hypothetical protein
LNEEAKVIRRMEGWQSRPAVCRDLNVIPSTVTAIVKNADKIEKRARKKTAATHKYTCGPVMQKNGAVTLTLG